MQVRNLLIAAGVAMSALTGLAVIPTAAQAQEYRPAYTAYQPVRYDRDRIEHRGYGERREWEARRFWALRQAEERRRAEWRFHHRYEAYRRY